MLKYYKCASRKARRPIRRPFGALFMEDGLAFVR
jgi:hypothetical protein